MDRPESRPELAREVWEDHRHQQEFEHELINRKTTWLLATQSILFTAYSLSFQAAVPGVAMSNPLLFRNVVAWLGFLIGLIVLFGVLALLRSKRVSWQMYQKFFERVGRAGLPGPLADKPLEWGVETRNTWLTLAPDVALPVVFMVGWVVLLVVGTPGAGS